jgi:hypothetical protein
VRAASGDWPAWCLLLSDETLARSLSRTQDQDLGQGEQVRIHLRLYPLDRAAFATAELPRPLTRATVDELRNRHAWRCAPCCRPRTVVAAAVLKVYASSSDGLSHPNAIWPPRSRLMSPAGIGLARQLSIQAHAIADRESAMDTRRAIDLALGVLLERTQCDGLVQ